MITIYKFVGRYNFILFPAVALIIFFPMLGRSFASDDISVLKRVAFEKNLLAPGFFRPLSDLTLLFNYMLGGLNPAGYYLFNIILHGLNSALLFYLCIRLPAGLNDSYQKTFALCAAILFLTYPFHSEGVVWILGRGAALSAGCAILSLIFVVRHKTTTVNLLLASLFYFIGLLAYESILLLPLMAIILLWPQRKRFILLIYGLAFLLMLIIHLILRVYLSGEILGGYGEGFFTTNFSSYAANSVRVLSRMFIPPIQHSVVYGVCTVILMLLILRCFYTFYRQCKNDQSGRTWIIRFLLLLAIACITPVMIGLSTKTSESDRLLYFPSAMLVCLVSFLLVKVITTPKMKFVIAAIVAYNLVLIAINEHHWIRASNITKDIVGTIVSTVHIGKIYVVNLPDEYEGAYIFRHGFSELFNNQHIIVGNHLTREQMLSLPDSIALTKVPLGYFIAPATVVEQSGGSENRSDQQGRIIVHPEKDDVVFYWNKIRLVKLNLP